MRKGFARRDLRRLATSRYELHLTVQVCNKYGNMRRETYEKVYAPEGDIEVVSVEAAQAVYGAPLIRGKGTAFRVKVRHHCTFCAIDHPVEVKFGLTLPEDMWGLSRPAGYRLPSGTDWYPEI